MNKLIPLLLLLLPLFLFAQVPQGLNYQAVAWDKNNSPKANLTINPKINIRNFNMEGPVVYSEDPSPITNAQGYFTITIGKENPTEFQKIDWASGPKFLQVIIDGISTTTQIMSVPYALYAEDVNLKAGTGIQINNHVISNTGDGDKDDGNELQNLKLTGYKLELDKGGGSVNLPKVGIVRYIVEPDRFFLSNGTNNISSIRIAVPETGTYLVLLKVEAIEVSEISSSLNPSLSFKFGGELFSYTYGQGKFSENSFEIMELNMGEIMQFECIAINIKSPTFIQNIQAIIQKIK